MDSRTHDEAEYELLLRLASPGMSGAVTRADVAAAGRAVWTWHGVDHELDELLRGAVDQRHRQA